MGFKDLFKKSESGCEEAINKFKDVFEATFHDNYSDEITITPVEMSKEEWIWVEGFKGTDRDMKCREFQFELGKQYMMTPEEVMECERGYHLCLTMNHVLHYYYIKDGNRFFRVRALVKKADVDRYGMYDHSVLPTYRDKLVACQIVLTEELTAEEVFNLGGYKGCDFTLEEKQRAIEVGLETVRETKRHNELVSYGYSAVFTQWLLEHNKYDIARAVGSQADLSMDMKCFMIHNNH